MSKPTAHPRWDLEDFMNDIPLGVIFAVIICLLAALYFTWLRRYEYRGATAMTIWTIVEDYISKFLLAIMLLATVVQVGTRNLFGGLVVTPWAEELALLAQVWLTFWCAGVIHRQRQHLNLQLVYDLMSPRVQRVFLIVGDLVAIAVLLPLAWAGFWNAKVLAIMETMALGISVSWFAYSVPLCLTLLALFSFLHLIDDIRAPTNRPIKAADQETFA